MWNHTVAILIGGQSARMGSPKHEVELPGGLTMLDAMLDVAHTIAKRVVIVGGHVKGQRCILDRRERQGPVAGIEGLLHSDIDDRYLVVGCDMPLLTADCVRPLLANTHAAVFQRAASDEIEPLPLMISSEMAHACTSYLDSGTRSLCGFMQHISYSIHPLEEEDLHLLRSVNTPEDLFSLPRIS